jgi:tRNA(Ile)-lysidine synthetase-like protein
MGPGTWLERRNGRFYWRKTSPSGRAGSGPEGKKECSRPGQRIILEDGGADAAWTWDGMDYRLRVRRYPRPAELDFPGSRAPKAIFDADLFSCTLQVRTRKDGDRFSPLGIASESRKLKVFLNEEKIPVGVRDEIPLVFDRSPDRASETLAWVPGHGISEYYKVGPRTRTILEMELICRNP